MPNSTDVASYILQMYGAIETMKLQKLVYYVQSWHIALKDGELFEEDAQAWAYGPVFPELYRHHRKDLMIQIIRSGNPETFKAHFHHTLPLIKSVIYFYSRKTGAELSVLTHKEDPWRIAREKAPDGQRGTNIISKISISRYYRSVACPFETHA